MTKTELFRRYNAARALGLDKKRLNKALGLAQCKAPARYITTLTDCTCPDRKYRTQWCKHVIAKNLAEAC